MYVSHLVGMAILLAAPALPAEPPTVAGDSADLEVLTLEALRTGNLNQLATLADKFRKLPPQQRNALPLRYRPGEVEFRFRGKFPGPESVETMLEYVIAKEDKAYETLLVVPDAEMLRLMQLRKALDTLAGQQRVRLEVQFLWGQGRDLHAENLWNILATNRDKIFGHLSITETGLGSQDLTNGRCDPALLPAKATNAEVRLQVRITK